MADAGLKLVVFGMGLLIVNVTMFEMPPPGALLNTATPAVPPVAISAALMLAVNWVLDTYVVARFDPFQRSVDDPAQPVPFTVRVNADPPAVADAGLKLVMFGMGLLIVNVTLFEMTEPADWVTVIFFVPAVAMFAALMRAVNWVGDTYVVGRFDPCQHTIASEIKLVPFTVRVKAGPPAVADAGLKLLMFGS